MSWQLLSLQNIMLGYSFQSFLVQTEKSVTNIYAHIFKFKAKCGQFQMMLLTASYMYLNKIIQIYIFLQ